MFKRRLLTKRQRRLLDKAGLMPLTSVEAMRSRPKKFGSPIPTGQLGLIARPHPQSLETRFALVQKFRTPEKEGWLLHPKLWAFNRIQELAPQYPATEIQKILKREAETLNAQHPKQSKEKKYAVPAYDTIAKYISKFNLRSKEQYFHIMSGIFRRRKPNALTEPTRQWLFDIGMGLFQVDIARLESPVDPAEFQTKLENRLRGEARFFQASPGLPLDELERRWTSFIRNRRTDFSVDIFRQIGPFSRSGKERLPLATSDVIESRSAPSQSPRPMELPKIPGLTRQQEKVYSLLRQGLSQKEIARALGITISTVSSHIKQIRKRAQGGG